MAKKVADRIWVNKKALREISAEWEFSMGEELSKTKTQGYVEFKRVTPRKRKGEGKK